MKVIHINLSKTWRGGERQVILLMQGLVEKKLGQILICKKNSALETKCNELDLPFFSINRSISFSTISYMKHLEKKGFNIIHCHESKGHTLGILYKKLTRSSVKIVLHRRVIFPIKKKITTGSKYSEQNISKIICISEAVEKVVKNSLKVKNTLVIPSMVPIREPAPSNGILREIFNIKEEKIIGYIAALTYEKDHFTFMDTAKELIDSGINNVHFVIIGEGKMKEELLEYSQKLKLQEHITFTGFLENVENVIPEIDILLFTSLAEGLGSTILDFFVGKKPVVCVQNGGSEEIVFDGKTGYICKKKDVKCLSSKVKLLLQEEEKAGELTENAFAFVKENFNIQTVTEQTVEVYNSLK
jgi:L-malate glycosyltransferase